MATRKKTAVSSKKKSSPKKVIEHDPFSMSGEEQEDEVVESPQIIEEKTEAEQKSKNDVKAEIPPVAKEVSRCIDFGGSLVISEVEIFRNDLLNALQGGEDLVLDGGEIQQVDGAGLQLLAAFAQETEKMSVAFKWQAASQVLCEASAQLGLTEILQLNEICQAA